MEGDVVEVVWRVVEGIGLLVVVVPTEMLEGRSRPTKYAPTMSASTKIGAKKTVIFRNNPPKLARPLSCKNSDASPAERV